MDLATHMANYQSVLIGLLCVQFLVWHRQSFPVHVGPCRYTRATIPFRVEDVLTHIANCARPLTEDLAVWLEDLSERYPYEWAQVLAQVRRKGGPSLNPAPTPQGEAVLKLGLGWSFWVKVQQIPRGWLARRQFWRLCLREWEVQRRLHGGRCYENTDEGPNIVNLATRMAKDLQKLIMTMGLLQWQGWASVHSANRFKDYSRA